jgi:hypothetical protein
MKNKSCLSSLGRMCEACVSRGLVSWKLYFITESLILNQNNEFNGLTRAMAA